MTTTKYYAAIHKAQATQPPLEELPDFDIQRLRSKGLGARLTSHFLENPRWALALLRRFWPNLKIGRFLLVTKSQDVRDILERQDEFETPYGSEMAEMAGGANFILGMRDGPAYRRMKSTVLSAFPVDEVEQMVRPIAARHAVEIMRGAAPGFDVVDGLLRVVPVRICRDYFGMLIDDEREFGDWANALSGIFFADPFASPVVRELAVVAADRMTKAIDRSVEAVRAGRINAETPLGRLVAMLDAPSPLLSLGELHSIMMGMIAGFTPTNLLASANCLDVVLSRPEAQSAIETAVRAGDIEALDRAIREAMRFKPIWIGPFRYVTRDALIARGTSRERLIKAGTTVMPSTLSAMFDADAVSDPEMFDPDRPARDYLVYGHGIHLCIGAAIAKVQIGECFRALFAKVGVRRAKGRAGRLVRLGAYPQHLKIEFEQSPLSKTVSQSMVTVVCEIRRGTSLAELRAKVERLGNPAIHEIDNALDASGIIHFASLAVACKADPADEGPDDVAHLVLELSGDGSQDEVLEEFTHQAGPFIGEIFEAAAGFDGAEPLEKFLRRHALKISPSFGSNSGLVFSGTPGHSVARIQAEADLADAVRAMIDEAGPAKESRAGALLALVRRRLASDEDRAWAFEPADSLLEKPKGSVWRAVKATLMAPPILAVVILVLAVFWWITYTVVFDYRPGILRNLLVGGSALVLTLAGLTLLLAFVALLFFFALRRLEKRDPSGADLVSMDRLNDILARENRGAQNNLTAISSVKPGSLRRLALRVAFYLISISARNVFRPGMLASIDTIHFARWVLLPGTNQLMFFSNFGGGWESYLEDFIVKAHAGLTSVWSNTLGFPKTRALFFEGATDGDRFKRWARAQQIPTLFWYRAYPEINTLRIRINSMIRQGIARGHTESEARDWLALFGSLPRPAGAIETEEMQSIIFGALGPLKHAAMVAVNIPDGLAHAGRRAWLEFVTAHTSFGDRLPQGRAMMAVFGPEGLRRLGLDDDGRDPLATFPLAFRQGMGNAARSRMLDDIGPNAPERWEWGSAAKPVDAMVICYAADLDALVAHVAELEHVTKAAGMGITARLPLIVRRRGKLPLEHFGFADGVSQPTIKGLRGGASGPDMHNIAPGEFIFGYKDEYGRYPPTPTIPASRDEEGLLSSVSGEGEPLPSSQAHLRDFGRNGSFVVIRQLEQHVEQFDNFCCSAAAQVRQRTGNEAIDAEWVAAKMVGRWRDGTSLVRNPNGRPAREPDNDFTYGAEDPQGLFCPLGSHVRRANPRDSLGPDRETQLRISKRHRILRRGRTYEKDGEKGLLFICLNADIERQYEFMQQTWVSSGSFHGLPQEKDPTIGYQNGSGRFSIPTHDGAVILSGLPSFVTTRGGGYFFMPSRSALRYMMSRL
ncbi:cytochrome P450 [Pseudaminobacter arsenicus]|uniref:Cytochrome P450 n=1 Tax=Borborobacter arsenicus TaxID=1851146 RepID=A0A432VBL2_9HYPH|nr:cytochrome P450 [Pseudaminobacter arsenicus]RUM99557.1 cytochrome P450 [Pseudaminobacter arsenicus]